LVGISPVRVVTRLEEVQLVAVVAVPAAERRQQSGQQSGRNER
jgi:hypothetical protein